MKTFRQRLTDICTATPDVEWITFFGLTASTSSTYRELFSRIHDYQAFFREKGLAEGDSVLIILKESLDLFAGFFAGIVHGALPAYFAYPSPKQSIESFIESIENLLRYNHIKIVIGFREIVEILSRVEPLKASPWFLGAVCHEDIPRRNAPLSSEFPAVAKEAFLQFSSGTTGAKKGVKISIPALFNQIEAYAECVNFSGDSKVVSWLPHYHDMGLIACMLIPFLMKVPIIMMSPFEWVKNPRLLLDAVVRHRGTHLWLPNFALGHLAKSIPDGDLSGLDLSSIQQIVCCSEPLLANTLEPFLRKFAGTGLKEEVIRNCYAMAENTFAMCSSGKGPARFLGIDIEAFSKEHRIIPSPQGRKIASAGTPLSNIDIRIIDDSGNILPEDRVGEVTINSNCMLEGYFNNPEATSSAFLGEYFKTGDLGFFHAGELYITGRKKDLIIVGGENVYPQDIEAILNEEPYLIPGRNLAFGVDDARVGTERVVVLAEVGEDVDPAGVDLLPLRKKIFDLLNISISEFLLLPHMTLKKGTAGKISRSLNKAEYLKTGFLQRVSAAPPLEGGSSGRLEDDVRNIVMKILPRQPAGSISARTSLLRSGLLDSFSFLDLVRSLEERFQTEIPKELWNEERFDSIEMIAKTVSGVAKAPDPALLEAARISLETNRNTSLAVLQRSHAGGGSSESSVLERLINNLPIASSGIYTFLLRCAGVRVGKNVRFLGRVNVKFRGRPGNIIIGNNVTLGGNIDLRNREEGRIHLHDHVYVEEEVRIVAARDGGVEIHEGAKIGPYTMIHSGGTVTIGRYALLAPFVQINSSEWTMDRNRYIQEQGFRHGIIDIGEDVWLGVCTSVLINSKINRGAIIGSNSVVHGEIPAFAVCAGIPAVVLRYR